MMRKFTCSKRERTSDELFRKEEVCLPHDKTRSGVQIMKGSVAMMIALYDKIERKLP